MYLSFGTNVVGLSEYDTDMATDVRKGGEETDGRLVALRLLDMTAALSEGKATGDEEVDGANAGVLMEASSANSSVLSWGTGFLLMAEGRRPDGVY